MSYKGLKLLHQVRRVNRNIYYQFGLSSIELELLTSLVILIIKTGREQHAKDAIMRKAMQPRKNAQFIAAFHTLENNGQIIKVKSRNGHAYKFTPDGLMIIERYDLQLTEEAAAEELTNKSVNDVINGLLN